MNQPQLNHMSASIFLYQSTIYKNFLKVLIEAFSLPHQPSKFVIAQFAGVSHLTDDIFHEGYLVMGEQMRNFLRKFRSILQLKVHHVTHPFMVGHGYSALFLDAMIATATFITAILTKVFQNHEHPASILGFGV